MVFNFEGDRASLGGLRECGGGALVVDLALTLAHVSYSAGHKELHKQLGRAATRRANYNHGEVP